MADDSSHSTFGQLVSGAQSTFTAIVPYDINILSCMPWGAASTTAIKQPPRLACVTDWVWASRPRASYLGLDWPVWSQLGEVYPPLLDGWRAGSRKWCSWTDSSGIRREYDVESKLTQLVETSERYHSPLSKLEYTYNEVGNRTSTTVTTETIVMQDSYPYDPTHQVTGVDYGVTIQGEEPEIPKRSVLYTYDAVGNRQYVETDTGSTTYAVNSLNEYTKVGEDSPTHDSNGNVTSLGEWNYRYDGLNRLAEVSSEDTTVRFLYDGKNRVVARNYGGRIVLNTYEDWNLIEEFGVSGQQQARYVHGPRIDEVVAMVNRHGLFYLHHDVLGNVTMLTDENGAVAETYSYTVNGEVTIRGGDGEERDKSAVGNRWMFTGREYLQEIGLYDYRNRVYSAKIGRFLQPDPMRFDAGDVNIYRYVLNNPANLVDPLGLVSLGSRARAIISLGRQTS